MTDTSDQQPGPEAFGGAGLPAITLREMMTALDAVVVELLEAPRGDDITLATAAILDAADLGLQADEQRPAPDVYLLVGVTEAEALGWLDGIANDHRPTALPAAILTKIAGADALRAAARAAGVALVSVNRQARWDHVYNLLQRVISRSHRGPSGTADDADLLAPDTDLFDLAQVVAANAGGMVSIEDAQSKVLAYSASDAAADELRTQSILGRQGPPDYLRALQQWGVFNRLRETDDVIDVPAHVELGTRRRLVVSIRQAAATTAAPRLLGSIWLQEGERPFTSEAADVLRGASAVAARLISRTLNAPTTEGLLIQRLFGSLNGGVDVATVASTLSIAATGPGAVIGFASQSNDATSARAFSAVTSMLRLHASSFRRDAVSTAMGTRAYVLLPQYKSTSAVTAWTRHLVDQFETQRGLVMRAAIALPLADLSRVPVARAEVDRVLDATALTFPHGRVTTLAESLTPVLLGEILDLVAAQPGLADPRLAALDDYDREHAGVLRISAQAFLAEYGDVRSAATALRVHPNTLRYRLRRCEEILDISLTDHADRLLLEIQLAAGHRHQDHRAPA